MIPGKHGGFPMAMVISPMPTFFRMFFGHPGLWTTFFPACCPGHPGDVYKGVFGWPSCKCTPLKINIEPANDGLVQMIFRTSRGVFSGSSR